jgi:hypothetical protein
LQPFASKILVAMPALNTKVWFKLGLGSPNKTDVYGRSNWVPEMDARVSTGTALKQKTQRACVGGRGRAVPPTWYMEMIAFRGVTNVCAGPAFGTHPRKIHESHNGVCVWFRRVNEKLSADSAAAVNTEIAVLLLS